MLKMRQNYILFLIIVCAMLAASCTQSSNNAKMSDSGEDDRPSLEYTDPDRMFSVVLEITSDSLLTCYNKLNDKEDIPLTLDISNSRFNENLAEWFNSLDTIQVKELHNTSALHIIVGPDITSETVDRVKTDIRYCGIEKYSTSNFDIN